MDRESSNFRAQTIRGYSFTLRPAARVAKTLPEEPWTPPSARPRSRAAAQLEASPRSSRPHRAASKLPLGNNGTHTFPLTLTGTTAGSGTSAPLFAVNSLSRP